MVNETRRCFPRLAALVVVFAAADPAALARGPEESPGRAEFERGARYYKAQEYEAALPWFQKAYELSNHRPSTIFALAQCERSLKMYDEAIAHFGEYLATSPPPADARAVRDTIELLEELRLGASAATKKAAPSPSPAPGEPRYEGPGQMAPSLPARAPDFDELYEFDFPPSVAAAEKRAVEAAEKKKRTAASAAEKKKTAAAAAEIVRAPETTATAAPGAKGPLPWVVIGGGAATAIAGGAMLGLGLAAVNRVDDGQGGMPRPGVSEAADRAPVFTGVGTGLLIVGLSAAGAGIAWLLSDGAR